MYNQSSSNKQPNEVTVDPYALFEALTGQKLGDRPGSSSSKTVFEDYDDLRDVNYGSSIGEMPKPDQQPKDVLVGCINPYALVEALVGHRLDIHARDTARIVSDVLQTDYDELFDLDRESVLFAGLELKDRRAEELKENDMKILEERDLVTPDLSRVQKLKDLESIGLKGLGDTRVKMCRLQNGKLRIVLDAHSVQRTVDNRHITMSINELACRFRRQNRQKGEWSPPNSTWRDADDQYPRNVSRSNNGMDLIQGFNRFSLGGNNDINSRSCHQLKNRFDDPVQGVAPNSYFIAALFSVFWSNPAIINRATQNQNNRRGGHNDHEQDEGDNNRRNHRNRFEVKFHDKGGRHNSKTRTVEVDHEIPINNSSMDPIYSRSSDQQDIWPALYEKAFAKWIQDDKSDRPDITQTAFGDPIKAMAQINGKEPHYFQCEKHHHKELLGIVRACSVNFKTINPMCAFTYATSSMYRGANLVANHAYSVLGWFNIGDRQYIVLRNPWGVTEPLGINSYPGLLDRVEPSFWRPACYLDNNGLLALECTTFQELFQYIGVAK